MRKTFFLLFALLLAALSIPAMAQLQSGHLQEWVYPKGSTNIIAYIDTSGNFHIAGALTANSVSPSPTFTNDGGVDTATGIPLVLGPTNATSVTIAHVLNQSGGACNLNPSGAYATNINASSNTGTVTVGSGTTTQAIVVQSGTGDLTCTSTDDISITATDDLTLNGGSAGSLINIGTNTQGNVVHFCDNDTTADTVDIGSAKDTISIAGQNVTVGTAAGTANVVIQSGSGDVSITSTDDIILLTNTGTGENITLTNTQGTAASAIALQATAGGIDVDCAAAKDVDIAGGQVLISSKDNAASAIGLTTNTGSSETITVTNTQGTSASAINLTATAGGIALNPVAGTPVAVGGEMTVTVPTKFEYLLQSTPLVDVGAIAGTTIYTVPTGKSAVITEIVFRNASGTFDQATDPVFSIGWNSTDYNNVVSSATYTNAMASAANYFILTPTGKSNSTVSTLGTTGQTLKINVTTAATASTTCTVSVFGYVF